MIMDFLKGMGLINLFPRERELEPMLSNIKFLSDEEAFRKDLDSVSNDIWNAIKIIQNDHPEC